MWNMCRWTLAVAGGSFGSYGWAIRHTNIGLVFFAIGFVLAIAGAPRKHWTG